MRKRVMHLVGLGFLVVASACSGQAGKWPLAIPKNSTVVAIVPQKFWQVDKYDNLSSSGQRIYFVNVKDVLSQPKWRAAGFPYCGDFTLTKVTRFKPFGKLRYTIIELRNSTIYLKLRFPPSAALATDLQKVVVPDDWQSFENTKDFRENVLEPQEAGIFAGPLAKLAEPVKLSLFGMVCSGQGSLGTAEFKGRTYLAVTLGDDGIVYNTLQLNQSARLTKVINDRLLDDIKTFQGVAGLVGIDGVEFAVRIYFRNFVSESTPTFDSLELYVPLGLARKFANADVTSQQLIDGSVVILDGNRVQVSLTL